MNRIKLPRVRYSGAPVGGTSASGAGCFDTSARLDTAAAYIRNATIPQPLLIGPIWNPDSSGNASEMPEVMDQPIQR